MADHTLTKMRRNDVLKALVTAQIDPRGFEWEASEYENDEEEYAYSTLTHPGTGSYFSFQPGLCAWSPGAFGRQNRGTHNGYWDSQLELLKRWTPYLRRG